MTQDASGEEPTLDTNALRGGPPLPAPLASTAARSLPRELGGYRITGLLGEGGMGVVYEAEQPSPRRLVALKVVRGAELVDEMKLKMFAREIATLARLDHPNIGRIYESGRTEEGRHFFAMELVRGPSLAAWLAERPAPPDRAEIELRLRLFQQICEAVHYAHQRGVIHRDLKPSNLIVTGEAASGSASGVTASPLVKILDFGLARITEEDVAATQLTEIGVIKGTLPYMAPEQARGDIDAMDVRTDVYALGVVLYELLTGKRPYTVETGSFLSAVRVICEQRPRPLAELWNATTRLDPDLATIAAKALEKDADDRYASAAAFGEDIGRFLTSQPILARPPSTMYQMKKLMARRKGLFTTAAAALVLVIAAAIGIGVLYVRSEANLARALEAEQTARREATTAERTSDFLVELFERANPERSRGETVTAREVMDEGARRVADELEGEPLMQARLMRTIGRVYLSLGLYKDARGLIDRSLALRREHLPAGSADIAESVFDLARTRQDEGDRESARVAYEEAISLYEQLGAEGVDGLTGALGDLGWMLGDMGEFAEANATLERALALAAARTPPDQARILRLLNNQSTVRMDQGSPDSALVILDRALEISRSLHGNDDRNTANILTNIGVAHALAGRHDLAARASVEALGTYRKIHGEDHPLTTKEMGNAGIYLAQQGKREEARPYFEGALAALTKIHGPTHPEVAQALMNLGLLQLESGDPKAAAANLARAVEIHGRGGETPSLSTALYHLANARGALGEFAEASRLLSRVIAIDERIFGPESVEVADDMEALASVERQRGQTADADRLELKMRSIREQIAAASATP